MQYPELWTRLLQNGLGEVNVSHLYFTDVDMPQSAHFGSERV